jgi:hypothetical protein
MSWVCLEQLEVLSRESLHTPWQIDDELEGVALAETVFVSSLVPA